MTPVDQRKRFVSDLESGQFGMSELCRAYGISRKTGYKWVRRWRSEGEEGLEDRSRRPGRCPHQTEPRCVEALLEARRERPLWGARKLLVRLAREHPDWPWPSASTAAALLKRNGLVPPRRRRRRKSVPTRPRVEPQSANEVWTVDFKGQFLTGDHTMCFPLTVADLWSRYLLGCRARRSTKTLEARPVFEALFREHGLPREILSDSGPPFAAPTAPRRLSQLAMWWIKLGIRPVLIELGHPEQNGCHERMHRTLKAATARPPAGSLAAQQKSFDGFRAEYNQERPHEALGMKTPAELYRRSPRPYPQRVPEIEYPGHFERRVVHNHGEVRWRGRLYYVSEVMRGETLGFEEVDDGLWSICYGPMLIGRYDERADRLRLL
ncbi:MAG TPA: IS481 family transposase [Thermoanaerobaculia bacterium]